MKYLLTKEFVNIPDGVEVQIKSRVVRVKGPLGEITKNLKHLQLDLGFGEDKKGVRSVTVSMWHGKYKLKAQVKTAASCINSMFNGVTKGFRYKMRIVHTHFPMKCEVTGNKKAATFKNFLGEKQDKTVHMKDGVTIRNCDEVKDQILIEGIDVDNVALSCALINQCVKTGKKDIRKFLDGIYVSDKGFQEAEE